MIQRPQTSTLLIYTALFFFFFNDTATTEISPLSLHDALPISGESCAERPDAIRADESVRCMGHERHADAPEPISDNCRWHARAGHDRGDGLSKNPRKAVTRKSCPSVARLRSWTSLQLSGRLRLSHSGPEGQAIAAAAGRQGRCGWQRSGRHQVAAADGGARHLYRVECDGIWAAQRTRLRQQRRFYSVRENEGRTARERRSPAVP